MATRGSMMLNIIYFKLLIQALTYWSIPTLREVSSQTNVILEYKLLASIVSAVCSVIQQS